MQSYRSSENPEFKRNLLIFITFQLRKLKFQIPMVDFVPSPHVVSQVTPIIIKNSLLFYGAVFSVYSYQPLGGYCCILANGTVLFYYIFAVNGS